MSSNSTLPGTGTGTDLDPAAAAAAAQAAFAAAVAVVQAATPDLFPTWGINFLGTIVSAVLYGVTVIQTFLYFQNWWNDPKGIRAMVLALFILDTFHQAQITQMMYFYLIDNFANPLILNVPHWTMTGSIASASGSAFIVEAFYVYRVHIVSRSNWLLSGIGGLLTVAHLGLNIGFLQLIPKQKTIADVINTVKPLVTSGLVIGTVVDTLLAGVLVVYLWRERGRFAKTDDILSKVIAVLISTGVIVSLVSIVQLITLLALPDTLWVLAFNLQLSKLYFNSMLATLNARNIIRGNGATNMISTNNGTISNNFAMRSPPAGTNSGLQEMRVQMDTSIETHSGVGENKYEQHL